VKATRLNIRVNSMGGACPPAKITGPGCIPRQRLVDMPAYKGILTPEQIKYITAYLYSLKGGD
jgi:mono/diheme cytochrome c family protein